MTAGIHNNLVETLAAAVGANHVLSDSDSLAFYTADLFYEGHAPLAVVAPGDIRELAGAVKAITGAGLAVLPRGGGLSYSAGYVAGDAKAVLIDTQRMKRILEINTEDMFVRAEAGVTWMALNDALAPLGLRTPFWGTGSGKHATVGGTLSQNGINYGSGQYGTSAESVIGLAVVTANGETLTTGSGAAAEHASPFLRYYGPDLTGLFLGDCGALGVKAEATLQLIARPAVTRFAAYDFDTVEDFAAAQSELARRQVAAECFGFDPCFTTKRTTYATVKDGLKLLAGVASAQGSKLAGLKEALKVAAAGRRYLDDIGYSVHVTVDGRDEAEADSGLKVVHEVLGQNGREIEASVPKVMRGTPFPDPTIVLGHEGERWVPMHGIVPHSQVPALLKGLDAFMDDNADLITTHGIEWAITSVPVGPSGVLIEPNFYWRDARTDQITRHLPEGFLKEKPIHAADPEARAAVRHLREGMIEIYRRLGGVHLQIGRVYPYMSTRTPQVQALLKALKTHLDPHGLMNPGALGL